MHWITLFSETPLSILQNLQSCGKFDGPFALFWCFCFTFPGRVWKSLFLLVTWSADLYAKEVSLVAFWDTSRLCLFLVLQAIWAFARGDILSTGTSRNVFQLCEEAWLIPVTSYNHPELAVVQSQLHKYSAHIERNCLTGCIPVDRKALIVVATQLLSRAHNQQHCLQPDWRIPQDWLQTTSEFLLCSMMSGA